VIPAMEQDAATLATLARELRYLRDRLDILDVINGYCRALDRIDGDLLTDAFHADVQDRQGPFLGDRAAFVPWALGLMTEFTMTHHSLTTHNCEIDGDVAHAESYCVFFVTHRDGRMLGAGAARYIDRLERREGKWALARRVEVMDCGYEMPASGWLGSDWTGIEPRRDRSDLSYMRPLEVPVPGSAV